MRTNYPFLCIAIAALLAVPAIVRGQAKRPNILWIIGEDIGPEQSCYGTPQVWTPHLDGLAAAGGRYTRAFTVTPVCSTSRSSFMTGMYAFTIGAHNHRSHRGDGFTLPPGVQVLTDHFRGEGYFTANIRQLAKSGDDKFYSGTGKTDWNFKYSGDAGKPFDSANWDDLKANQPFFAQINFSETHRGGAWNKAHKVIEKTADPFKVKTPPYYPDHLIVGEDWAQYLNAVMSLDKKVGYVLKRLEEDGLAENTVVIFFGDHGRAHVRGKQWPYDSGLHVPLIIRWPKHFPAPPQIKPGEVDDRLIASIDWSATSLAIAGITPPLIMQGRVFLGQKADKNMRRYVFGGRDRGDETVDRIRTVRDKRYRYIRNFYPDRPFLQMNRYKESSYPVLALLRILHERGELTGPPAQLLAPTRPTEELYDLDNDPYEIHNLAESKLHAATLARLCGALDAWIIEINDQGRFSEDPAIPAASEARMHQIYKHQMEAAHRRMLKRLEELEKK